MKFLFGFFFLFSLSNVAFAQTSLKWVKQFGGIGKDESLYMAVDYENNIYLTGVFYDTIDADPGIGVELLSPTGICDIYLIKLDAFGTLIWARQMRSEGYCHGGFIVLDDSANIYLAGRFSINIDCDPSSSNSLFYTEFEASFLCKLDKNGNFIYAKKVDTCFITDIALDDRMNIYFSGYFYGTIHFIPGINNQTSNGFSDIIVCKINKIGDYVWAKSFGGKKEDRPQRLFYNNGKIILNGIFRDTTDFDPNVGIFNLYPIDGQIFLMEMDTSGHFIRAKSFGIRLALSSSIEPWDFFVDANRNVYIMGTYSGIVDINPSLKISSLNSIGSHDVYICKLDNLWNLLWAKSVGTKSNDIAGILCSDHAGNIYTTIIFEDTLILNTADGTKNIYTTNGNLASLILKLNQQGNILCAKQIGGGDNCLALSFYEDSSLYIYGSFENECYFDIGTGSFTANAIGKSDIFLQKMDTMLCESPIIPSDNQFVLYPNPTTNISDLLFTAQSNGNYKIIVYDLLGRKLESIEGNYVAGSNRIPIDLSNQSSSLYLLHIYLDNLSMQTLKLLKQ